MIQVILFCIICAIFTPLSLYAGDSTNYEDAELIKLRIRELELKKEILELEAKKNDKTITQSSSPQSNATVPSTNYSTSNSNYIRGPRGGCYTFSKSGNKRYVDRSLCN
ncbi:MAG: hypothetical protein Q8R74_13300 [Methylophilus sp.]|nr:hypothetical protein [Methylophilus sp.]